jgi:mannitol/fructose-specific phosphotransferase system IIA component (Ntr-type)
MPPEIIATTARSLADYTLPPLIVPRLRSRNVADIIAELTQVLHQHGCVRESLPFYHAALNQEFLSNPASGRGIAFPHARSASIKFLRFALGRAPAPVQWRTQDHQPIQLIFLIAIPATEATLYLQVLSRVAKLSGERESLAELMAAADAAQMHAALERCRLLN